MSNYFQEYTKKFLKRNFSVNGSLRNNKREETTQDASSYTIIDFILLPVLPIVTLIHFIEKKSTNKDKES